MKKIKNIKIASILMMGLTGCSSLSTLQMQHKTLSSGQAVTVDEDVKPSDSWGCKFLTSSTGYNWDDIKSKATWKFTSPNYLLADMLVDYANQNNIKANYINMILPGDYSVTMTSGKYSETTDYGRGQAYGEYYQCQQINPDHKVGHQSGVNVAVGS